MTITPELTETLHATYQRLVARPVELDYLKRQMWSVWKNYCQHDPFTDQDLVMVVRYLNFKIKKGDYKPSRLLFRNLIESPDFFQEERTDARGWSRAPRGHTDKAQVLKATGRAVQVKDTAKSADQIMRESEAFRKFREAGERL